MHSCEGNISWSYCCLWCRAIWSSVSTHTANKHFKFLRETEVLRLLRQGKQFKPSEGLNTSYLSNTLLLLFYYHTRLISNNKSLHNKIIIQCFNEGKSYASFADYSPCTSIHTYLSKHLTDLWCSSKISLLPKHISFHVVALHSKWTARLPHALMPTIQADRRHETCCICCTQLCPLWDPLTVYTTSITRNNVSWLKCSAANHHSMGV